MNNTLKPAFMPAGGGRRPGPDPEKVRGHLAWRVGEARRCPAEDRQYLFGIACGQIELALAAGLITTGQAEELTEALFTDSLRPAAAAGQQADRRGATAHGTPAAGVNHDQEGNHA